MADLQNGSLHPTPRSQSPHGKNHLTPSAAQNPSQHKRNHRPRKNHSQSLPQVDGSVSDSVTNPMASPHSKKPPKQRQQSVAIGALPKENGIAAKANGQQKPRPVSLGGNMLPATPLKEQAYAGPTFQVSPAASSLPVPKFASRSVPNVAAPKSLEACMAGDNTPDEVHSSPEPDVAPPPRAAQQSPLDILFKADKAEKEKSRSASVQSPEMQWKHAASAVELRNPFQHANKSVFLNELDGNGALPSPKTLPPERNPSPGQRTVSSSGVQPVDGNSDSDKEAYTQSLKDLLFNNVNGTPPQNATPPPAPPRSSSNPRTLESPFHTPSPYQRSASGPSTPTPSAEQQNHYSLHYGNRNLSPLFKAARSDTPARPSGLRQQELASDSSPTTNGPPPTGRPRPPQIDPDSFSRNYLDQQIRASQPATLPPLPLTKQTNNASSIPTAASSEGAAAPSQHGVSAVGPGSGTGASPRTSTNGTSHDIRTMEDDLRRMLKMNVLSS